MFYSKKDKVLFFLPSFADGGAEETIVSLANQFYHKKTKVFFLIGNKTGKNKDKLEKKINLINLDKDRLLKCLKPIKNILDKVNPKVVITTLTHSNLFFCIIKYFFKYNFKLIIRESNTTPEKYFNFLEFLKFKLLNFLKKIFYNNADYVIAINYKSKQELISLGIFKNKIKLFNNPSIKENFVNKTKKKIIEKKLNNKRFILYVGRFSRHKNLRFLIKVFSNIQKKVNIFLVLIGQGQEKQKLKDLVDRLNIKKKVFFLKYKSNPLPYMKKAKLYVSLSEYEGQPNSVIQSLGCGTNVLIKKFPGLHKNLKRSENLIILNRLDHFKTELTILEYIKKNKKKTYNKKILNKFGEKQFMKKISKLIYV